MARSKKWANEEMWQQAVIWRKGGLTYSDICGQLAKPENLKRFGLYEVPSEDTVRREVTRLTAKKRPVKPGQAESDSKGSGRHEQALRDLITYLIEYLSDLTNLTMPPDPQADVLPYDDQAITVHRRIEENPAFQCLWEHLKTTDIPNLWECFESAKRDYFRATLPQTVVSSDPEYIKTYNEETAKLLSRRNELWTEYVSAGTSLINALRRILVQDTLPGSCHLCSNVNNLTSESLVRSDHVAHEH